MRLMTLEEQEEQRRKDATQQRTQNDDVSNKNDVSKIKEEKEDFIKKINESSKNVVKSLNEFVKSLEKISKNEVEEENKKENSNNNYLNRLEKINNNLWQSLHISINQGFDKGVNNLISGFAKGAGIWGQVLQLGAEMWMQTEKSSAAANKYEIIRIGIDNLDKLDTDKALERRLADKMSLTNYGQVQNYDKFMAMYVDTLNPRQKKDYQQSSYLQDISVLETLFQAQGAKAGQASSLFNAALEQGENPEQIRSSLQNILNNTKNLEQAMPKATDKVLQLYQATSKYGATLEDSMNSIKTWDKELRKGIITINDLAHISISGRNMDTGRAAGLSQALIQSGLNLPKELTDASSPFEQGFILRKLLSSNDQSTIKAMQDFAMMQGGGDRYKGAFVLEKMFGDLFTKEMIMQIASGKSAISSKNSVDISGTFEQIGDAKKIWESTSTTVEKAAQTAALAADSLAVALNKSKESIENELEQRNKLADKIKEEVKNTEDSRGLVGNIITEIGSRAMERDLTFTGRATL